MSQEERGEVPHQVKKKELQVRCLLEAKGRKMSSGTKKL